MKGKKVFIYIEFVFSILLIFSGIVLVILSFRDEVLDNKYIVEKSTGFTSDKKDLHKGEFYVAKDIDYVLNGRYKITYMIEYNQNSKDILFADKSKVSITDVFGDGYKLDTSEIFINNDPIRLYSSNTITSDYEMNYDNNTFEIIFPKDKIFRYNRVTLFIDLIERFTNTEFVTSKEAFYSFTPNVKNEFYKKKGMQSYSIDGSGSIVLKNKQ